MRCNRFLYLLSGCFLLLLSSAACALGPDPARDWRSAETAHFRLHFESRHRQQAGRIAELAERIHPRVTRWLDWTPRSKTEIVLADFMDQANGLATPLPYNTIYLFLASPDDGELLQNDDWLKLVFTHEYTHIVHLDKAAGTPLALRSVFGRFPVLFPNVWQPTWLIEGLAVYAESSPAEKLGRLRNSPFEALMRVEAEKGFLALAEVNADGRGLPLNRAYLYGAYFHDFLTERYGGHAVPDLVAAFSDNLLPFRVHSNPEAVTGKSMDVLWDDFVAYLRQRFSAQRAALQDVPKRQGTAVFGARDLGAIAQAADGTAYVVRYDGLTEPELLKRTRNGDFKSIAQVARTARVDVSSDGQVLVVQPEVIGEHDYFNDLYVLRDGALERLTVGGRWREAVWLGGNGTAADGFAGLRREADGGSALWRFDAKGVAQTELYRAAPGEALLGLAAQPNGPALAFVSLQRGVWRLLEWTPQGLRVRLADSAIKYQPRYARDGEALLFLADYDNVPNLWRLGSRADGTPELALLTHTHTAVIGLSSPAFDGLFIKMLNAGGETLSHLPEPFLPIATRQVEPLDDKPSSSAPGTPEVPLAAERPYSAWPSLLPHSWFPVLQVADGAVIAGALIFGSDILGIHQYVATPLVELTQGEALGELSYLYDQRLALSVARRLQVEATAGGRQKELAAYTIDDHVQALALLPHTRREQRIFVGVGGALDRSDFKVVNGGHVRFQDERLVGLVVGYDSRKTQWLSEGPSQGTALTLIAEQGLAGSDFPGAAQHLAASGFVPLGKTVLAGRLRFGRADADAEAFSLGGIEGVFLQSLPQLNQRSFGLRGYDGSAQQGREMRLGTVEWRVPLADIDRHGMLPPIGINRLSATLFMEAGSAWSSAGPHDLRSRGVELLGEIKLGYRLEVDARLGYVEALDGLHDKRVYLSVGRAF
jgi:hypothetical protein